MTCDAWWRWTFSQNFSSLCLTVWAWRHFEDLEEKDHLGKPSWKIISFWLEKVQREGGDHVRIQTCWETFSFCLCFTIFDYRGLGLIQIQTFWGTFLLEFGIFLESRGVDQIPNILRNFFSLAWTFSKKNGAGWLFFLVLRVRFSIHQRHITSFSLLRSPCSPLHYSKLHIIAL